MQVCSLRGRGTYTNRINRDIVCMEGLFLKHAGSPPLPAPRRRERSKGEILMTLFHGAELEGATHESSIVLWHWRLSSRRRSPYWVSYLPLTGSASWVMLSRWKWPRQVDVDPGPHTWRSFKSERCKVFGIVTVYHPIHHVPCGPFSHLCIASECVVCAANCPSHFRPNTVP